MKKIYLTMFLVSFVGCFSSSEPLTPTNDKRNYDFRGIKFSHPLPNYFTTQKSGVPFYDDLLTGDGRHDFGDLPKNTSIVAYINPKENLKIGNNNVEKIIYYTFDNKLFRIYIELEKNVEYEEVIKALRDKYATYTLSVSRVNYGIAIIDQRVTMEIIKRKEKEIQEQKDEKIRNLQKDL